MFLAVTLLIIIYLRSIWDTILLCSNITWLFKNNNQKLADFTDVPFINIVIPVLREQNIILETVRHFEQIKYPKNKYKIYIITTEKESIEKSNLDKISSLIKDVSLNQSLNYIKSKYLGLLSLELLEKMFNDYANKAIANLHDYILEIYNHYPITKEILEKDIKHHPNTEIINYPNNNETATIQLNYGLEQIYQKSSKDSWVCVYNADSRPNLDTFQAVAQTKTKYEVNYKKSANIIQQSSLFTLNLSKIRNNLPGFLLQAGGLYQTRFTLIRELFLFRSQSFFSNVKSNKFFDFFFKTQSSYCVGHGMFINFDYFKSRNFYPVETLNEDVPFGYYTCVMNEPIIPLQLLENSDTPITISSLINQKTVWFNPFLELITCWKQATKQKKYISLALLNIFTMRFAILGIVWLLQSGVLIYPIIYFVITKSLIGIIFWIIALGIYWNLSILIIIQYLPRLKN